MLSLMFIYLFVSIFPFIYLGLSHFLQTICIFYKQFTNILAIFEYFFKFQNLTNPYFMRAYEHYLPQHCLYLRPDPHGQGSFLPTLLLFLCILTVSFPSLVIVFLTTSFLSIFCLISDFNK